MIDQAVHSADRDNVEAVLRDELARGDAMAGSVLPILRHLITAEDSSVFSDEILARVRGMLADLANTLLDALAERTGQPERAAHPADEVSLLTRAFLENQALLAHLHALALEWQLTERLQSRLALDPVVSPLLQSHVSSHEGAIQDLAMKFLAAQARWCQSQRRMRLSLFELPADLFHEALVTLSASIGEDPEMIERAAFAEAALRRKYDEGAGRLGLATQLAMSMRGEVEASLSVANSGVALFLSALAIGSRQGRDAVVLSTHEAQLARLALALRTAGLSSTGVEQQFLALHPDITLPQGFDRLGADKASAILSSGRVAG
ncbi:hypothetical protein [Novosphingobium pentaromativorans]|uniref:Uncharacterized protein n=1 Tax=Novosphingobium pentaromativorans US6-1 TaxID=1088721 RepID=G6EIP0_9SPHN|nr:hypothetical protein [Novosphingobium pentaromativorans]AIT78856.1 hypothetical protein JI59_03015 [Novosphingobium pentaromativorans US6-1]EHJ58982.1 hypothetical protein NSU_4211 [Novosphingobium pentaromativorans US6-1]